MEQTFENYWIEQNLNIGSIETLLEDDYEIEVSSPDGWVPVSAFVDKGEWEEYVLHIKDKTISCNENHLFETSFGWLSAKDILDVQEKTGVDFKGFHFLYNDSKLYQGFIKKTGNKIPIVDIQVEHENHRYYTDGVSSHNTGVGKSLAMCHLAAAALSQGRNVLYITLEMSEERIAERIDANLFDVNIGQLNTLSKDAFTSKVRKISDKTRGKLIIKEYPTATAHVGHFRALLNELKLKKNFIPDMIFIDYLNICSSYRMKGIGGSINSYSLIKAIAEEIRGLAVEFNVPIWSATQVNREGFGNTDVDLTNTSECIAITEEVKLRDGTPKKIGDIEIGDQLKSQDDYKTVMFRHHNKVKSCVRIRTKRGNQIIVSKDHIFPCQAPNGEITRLSVSSGLSVGYKLNTK